MYPNWFFARIKFFFFKMCVCVGGWVRVRVCVFFVFFCRNDRIFLCTLDQWSLLTFSIYSTICSGLMKLWHVHLNERCGSITRVILTDRSWGERVKVHRGLMHGSIHFCRFLQNWSCIIKITLVWLSTKEFLFFNIQLTCSIKPA